ncbi:MAG: alpha/beta fold hydrolase [Gammaproteobacteria bacterium]|nr:alpha/beta fold hydrolase [Gammaproteobacteria bacterium]
MNSQTNSARSVNGTAYDLIGPEDAPVVLLIHGLGLNRRTWHSHIPRLNQHFRVLNIDLFGHGESAPPPEKPSLALFSEQLKSLLDELSIDLCGVIGFSLGGMINRRFAMDYPWMVSALVILNSPHERGEEAQKLVEQRAADTLLGGPAANIETTLRRWFTDGFRNHRSGTVDKVRQWVVDNDPVIYAQCRQVLAKGVIELIRPTPAIDLPTLVITCENDTGSTPAMTFAIASEIRDAETLVIPDLQHMGLMERPREFVEPTNKFLKRHL